MPLSSISVTAPASGGVRVEEEPGRLTRLPSSGCKPYDSSFSRKSLASRWRGRGFHLLSEPMMTDDSSLEIKTIACLHSFQLLLRRRESEQAPFVRRRVPALPPVSISFAYDQLNSFILMSWFLLLYNVPITARLILALFSPQTSIETTHCLQNHHKGSFLSGICLPSMQFFQCFSTISLFQKAF